MNTTIEFKIKYAGKNEVKTYIHNYLHGTLSLGKRHDKYKFSDTAQYNQLESILQTITLALSKHDSDRIYLFEILDIADASEISLNSLVHRLYKTILNECENDGDTITADAIKDFDIAVKTLEDALKTRDNALSIMENAKKEK